MALNTQQKAEELEVSGLIGWYNRESIDRNWDTEETIWEKNLERSWDTSAFTP